MTERLRLFNSSGEIDYSDGYIELSDDYIINQGEASIISEPTVTAGSTLEFRKNDGSTVVFTATAQKVEKALLWNLYLLSEGYELNNLIVQNVYENQSPEAIVEDIIDNETTNLTYASTASSGIVIEKYIANGYALDIIQDMIEALAWSLRIDQNGNVYFEPPGTTNNGVVLSEDGDGTYDCTVDSDVEDPTQVINHIKLRGGFEGRSTQETISGTGTEFTLSYKPSGAVRAIVSSTELGPEQIESVDAENKTVTFTSSRSNPTFFYTYNRPVVVDDQDDESVNTYGRITKQVTKSEIITSADGREFTRKFLQVFAQPPRIITVSVPGLLFDVNVGEKLSLKSARRSIDGTFIVKTVRYVASSGSTVLVLGNREADFWDWRREVESRIKKIEKRFTNDSEEIFSRTISHALAVELGVSVTFEWNSPQDTFIPANVTAGVPDGPTLCWCRTGYDDEPDCSLNDNRGTWNGTGVTAGNQFTQSGFRLSAGVFNGTDNYVQASSSPFASDPVNAEVSMFLKFDSFGADQGIASRLFGGSIYPRIWYDTSEDELVVDYRLDGVTKQVTVPNFSSGKDTSTFYHVSVNFRAGVGVTVFVDGVFSANNNDTGTDFDRGANAPRFGYDADQSLYFDGVMDEPMIFDKGLNTSERQRLTDKNITGSPDLRDDMVLWYSFDNPTPGDKSTARQTVN